MRRCILAVLVLAVPAACADTPTAPIADGSIQVNVVAATAPFLACGSDIKVTVTVKDSRGRPCHTGPWAGSRSPGSRTTGITST